MHKKRLWRSTFFEIAPSSTSPKSLDQVSIRTMTGMLPQNLQLPTYALSSFSKNRSCNGRSFVNVSDHHFKSLIGLDLGVVHLTTTIGFEKLIHLRYLRLVCLGNSYIPLCIIVGIIGGHTIYIFPPPYRLLTFGVTRLGCIQTTSQQLVQQINWKICNTFPPFVLKKMASHCEVRLSRIFKLSLGYAGVIGYKITQVRLTSLRKLKISVDDCEEASKFQTSPPSVRVVTPCIFRHRLRTL